MNTYVLLFRGINVGGKNLVPMAKLKICLEALGFSHVATYIASGNAIVRSKETAEVVQALVEKALPDTFTLDSALVRVLVLNLVQMEAVVDNKPKGFGETPDSYRYDVIFLMGITASDAMSVFKPRDGVDVVWQGDRVIYSQRLEALRTKSRLSAIVGTPQYASMTIRTWGTTIKLLELLRSAG